LRWLSYTIAVKWLVQSFANFNNFGELMLTERPKPLRPMIQGGGSAGTQISAARNVRIDCKAAPYYALQKYGYG
jgi:hypothetical protein